MSESTSSKHAQFFSGEQLSVEEFKLEQQYLREKLRRHNRSLHGFGIVSGLRVSVNAGQILVEPGLALDCEGNELLIETVQAIVPATTLNWHTAYLNIRYLEQCAGASSGDGAPDASGLTVGRDGFELAVGQENFNRGHRHLRARWLACGQPHALTVAKLRHGPHGWRIDRGYRAPQIK
jgi:hypothetical protein